MNRFKFRGISKDTGEFVYGFYVKGEDTHWIIESLEHQVSSYWDVAGAHEVYGFTVGINTGVKDFLGNDIYEVDILEVSSPYDDETTRHVVRYFGNYNYPAFELDPTLYVEENGISYLLNAIDLRMKVIGNIHENPELMEE